MARHRRALASLAAILLYACQSPTIPLPPPNAEDIVATAAAGPAGWLVISAEPVVPGGATSFPPGARVEVVNRDLLRGVIVWADTDGRFTSDPLPGEFGDRITIAYEDDAGERSAPLCLIVRDGRQGLQDECNGR